MKYLFYAIVFDVAENTTAVGSSENPAKEITTNIQNVTGISINPSSAQTKNIGENFTILATVLPSDANNKGINWSSSNSGIATVDSSGNVHCLAAGKTTITATASDGNGAKAELSLTVRNPINSLTLDKDQTTILKDGYTSTITATTDPSNYDGANISWTIADTSIATVSVSGKTATIRSTSKLGQTTLTVSAGGITKTVNVSVVNFVTTTYSYTGSVQQVDLPAGTYKLEVWGAEGGTAIHQSLIGQGGKGGYSTGIFSITSNTTLFIVIGKSGSNGISSYINPTNSSQHNSEAYNGGGYGYGMMGGGGGATHISTRTGVLSSLASYKQDIIIVAGGGGGGDPWTTAGSGGGFKGGSCSTSEGGTQLSGGAGNVSAGDGSFGKGANAVWQDSCDQGGGGGGYYGGGSGNVTGSCGGGGGSGYIDISKLTNAFMYGYNVSTSSATATKTYSTTNVSSTPTSNYAKSGDGAARITPIN